MPDLLRNLAAKQGSGTDANVLLLAAAAALDAVATDPGFGSLQAATQSAVTAFTGDNSTYQNAAPEIAQP